MGAVGEGEVVARVLDLLEGGVALDAEETGLDFFLLRRGKKRGRERKGEGRERVFLLLLAS